ncbi:MAG: SAM-dependent chlorinase/fluorinase [Candidatus Zixiibacteriota bacterium]
MSLRRPSRMTAFLKHMNRPIITLTTDFGTRDGYVGAVKGVIKRINPQAEIVDVTHEIEPFDVLGAAFALNSFYRFFPRGTIHLVVVDPGVGGRRQPLLIKSEDFFFVGPDNGILSFLFRDERITEIIVLSAQQYFLNEISNTFHARDLFAPVAAYLSLGVDVNEFGKPAKECLKLNIEEPKRTGTGLVGEVIHIDRFGNLITNIPVRSIQNKRIAKIVVANREIARMSQPYFEIPLRKIGAIVGSSGFLEMAVNQGSAWKVSKARIGSPVKISFR